MANEFSREVSQYIPAFKELGIEIYASAGTPTANGPVKGALVVDTTNGKLYINTGTASSATWNSIGDINAEELTLDGPLELSGSLGITSSSANALVVGRQGGTAPVLKVNAATASVATGISLTGAAAGGGMAVAVISTADNEALTLNARGSGTITLGSTSTGNISLNRQTTINGSGIINGPALLANGESIAAGGGANAKITIGSGATAPGVFVGSGAPTVTAPKGSLYLRTDGSTTNDRAYINTDAGTTWTALTTAA
jgi:hypothetical protein